MSDLLGGREKRKCCYDISQLRQSFVGYIEYYPHLLLPRSRVYQYAHASKHHFHSVIHDALDKYLPA